MHILVTYGGNPSLAMIQWAYENKLQDCYVVSVDTGFSAPGWQDRMQMIMAYATQCNFTAVPLKAAASFEAVMQEKRDFPTRKFQWCASLIKGLPLLTWLDDIDPDAESTVLVAHRRAAAPAYQYLPEHIEVSDFYGDRPVWHPLYDQSDSDIQALVSRTPIAWHDSRHRALECDPCINSDAQELRQLSPEVIQRATALEQSIQKPMFKADVYQEATNLAAFCSNNKTCQAKSGSMQMFTMGCGDPYGCGT